MLSNVILETRMRAGQEEVAGDIINDLKEQIKNNPDYINSNIVLSEAEDNVAVMTILDGCKNFPEITLKKQGYIIFNKWTE